MVEEYDKPILDALHEPDTAEGNREHLRGLYATILEVHQSLNGSFLEAVTQDPAGSQARFDALYNLLLADNYAGLRQMFGSLFAGIPYELSMSGRRGQYEGHYAVVLYAYVDASGLAAQLEEPFCQHR